jgi:hypothetical protein
MDKIAKGMTRTGQQAKAGATIKRIPGTLPRSKSSFPWGTMREPSQSPGQAQGDLEEVKQALQDLEEAKGDWSKGGG